MGRPDINPLVRFRIHPALGDAAAWKDESVRPIGIDHGELNLAVEWRGRDRLPHCTLMPCRDSLRFDPDQIYLWAAYRAGAAGGSSNRGPHAADERSGGSPFDTEKRPTTI
jgi:hypothetical protein